MNALEAIAEPIVVDRGAAAPAVAPVVAAEPPAVVDAAPRRGRRESADSVRVNRFDGVALHDVPESHWRLTQGLGINADLAERLACSQALCQHQYNTNPNFRGIVTTLAGHVVGRRGPRVQVRGSSTAFNETVEREVRRVFAACDPAGRHDLKASLRLDVVHAALGGSSLTVLQEVRRQGPVTLGWQTIHPRRLVTPVRKASDPNVVLGKRFDPETGAPLTYYFDRPRRFDQLTSQPSGVDVQERPASMVCHFFLDEEGGQVTGAPLMHSSVRAAEQLAAYDRDVMKAAHLQARQPMVLQNMNPEYAVAPGLPEPIVIDDVGATYVPDGYAAQFPSGTQPIAKYETFRNEKLAEIGRPIQMPLMLIKLSSRESNFSSAQFDGQIYSEGVAHLQHELGRQKVKWLVELIINELVLAGVVTRPRDYEIDLAWERPPHAQLDKIARAIVELVDSGIIAPETGADMLGVDYEEERRRAARNRDLCDELELPRAPANTGRGTPVTATAYPDRREEELARAAEAAEGAGDNQQQEDRRAVAA
ncbi:MAG: phage portal protein [Planctomycetota bacterium]